MKVLKSKGFTLVELLIVMAVAVVLSSAAIPAITGQVEKAKESNDLMTLADAYADAYAQAALMASTKSNTTAFTVEITPLEFQQATEGWTITTAPKIGGLAAPADITSETTTITFTFTPDGAGGVKHGTTAPAAS